MTLELHHIVWVKDDGGNEPTNLIALCPNCHSLHTHGHIPDDAIRHWKGILHALNHAFSKESMDLLIFLSKKDVNKMWFSGDGVLKFAGLIAAGLVRFDEQVWANTLRMSGPAPTSSHKLKLTDKGKALVDAWLNGDEEAYRNALSGTS
ncbi:MAG: HNH endonuclease signature motif containing protein [Thermodesulfobacteriota bacterium]